MKDEQKFYLDGALKSLEYAESDLESQIAELETLDGIPTETNYIEILNIAFRAITVADHMTRVLKTIAEDANLQQPETVIGARGKVNLGYSHTEKDETALIALIGARAILNSHNSLVDDDEARVAEICHEIMEETN